MSLLKLEDIMYDYDTHFLAEICHLSDDVYMFRYVIGM